MVRLDAEGGVLPMDELEKVIAEYTETGMDADAGKTVLVSAKAGKLRRMKVGSFGFLCSQRGRMLTRVAKGSFCLCRWLRHSAFS